jgi:hypothetical protein
MNNKNAKNKGLDQIVFELLPNNLKLDFFKLQELIVL